MKKEELAVGMKVRFKDMPELRHMWRGQELEVVALPKYAKVTCKHLTVPDDSIMKVGNVGDINPSLLEPVEVLNNEEALNLLEKED